MKLLILISATLASATLGQRVGAPLTEACYTKARTLDKGRGRLPSQQCVFPFVYKGNTFDSCTTYDTKNGEAWCGTRHTVRFNTRSGIVKTGDVGDCDFEYNSGCEVEKISGGFCSTNQDCYRNGNACDPVPIGGTNKCICKNNVCKVSSGCGTTVQNWFMKCSECSKEHCEDEGVCSFRRGRCTGPEEGVEKYCCGGGECRAEGEIWSIGRCTTCHCRNGQELCTGACDPAPPPSSCRTKSRGPCVFPFSYKGRNYYKCTYDHTINHEAWCGVVPTVGTDGTEYDDCSFGPDSPCETE